MTLTAEQLEDRRSYLGASEAADAIGLGKYRTPYQLWKIKTGQSEPEKPDKLMEAAYWGNMLEDTVAREFSRRTGMKVQQRKAPVHHADYAFALAHLDRIIVGLPGNDKHLLQCKTSNQYLASQWGPSGSDQVPDEYIIQEQHELACADYQIAHLAVLIGGQQFRQYVIPRDDTLLEGIMEREAEFWQHVVDRIAPEPTTLDDLLDLYPSDTGGTLLADPALTDSWRQLVMAKESLKTLGEEAKIHEMALKCALQDHGTLVAPDGAPLITWKQAKDSQIIDWEAIARKFLDRMPGSDADEAISAETRTKTGSRRFLVKQPTEAYHE
jgi:putative phage-type endonuclease